MRRPAIPFTAICTVARRSFGRGRRVGAERQRGLTIGHAFGRAHLPMGGGLRRLRPCVATWRGERATYESRSDGRRRPRDLPCGVSRVPRWIISRLALLLGCLLPGRAADEAWFDRVQDALTFSTPAGDVRARLSGSIDLEGYRVQLPAPGVLATADGSLLETRLTTFLDAQFGPRTYFFAQARADHGFDPSENRAEFRLDEVALRFAPGPRRQFNLQFGRFATLVGNWTTRHGSWANPFITAPLPYEHLTGMWDTDAIRNSNVLLQWSHVRPGLSPRVTAIEKSLRLPIVWGPSYADGVMLADKLGKFRYAVEAKLGSLSSRPEAWRHSREQRHHPTFSARGEYRPNATWQVGVSASDGAYLREFAARSVANGYGRGDYRQQVVAADLTYAYRHWQIWSEVFATRFTIPNVGDADTVAWYAEARYRITPRFSGALRWNQQVFATIPDRTGPTRWGHDVWRLDAAPVWRLTAHTQLKLQYSLQHGDSAPRTTTRTLAAQATVRF